MEPPSRPKYGYWPQGGSGKHIYENFDRSLRLNARWHAVRAVTLYTASNADECMSAAVSTGCAVELLAKAYLASIEPTLLAADRDDGQSILVLSGRLDRASISPTAVRTKSALECLLIAKKLHPTLRWNPKTDMTVLNVRNAACHLGLADMGELASAIKIMVKVVEDLLAAMALPRESFWGVHTLSVVDGLLDTAAKELAVAVNAKVARARIRLQSLTHNLSTPESESLLELLAGAVVHSYSDHDEPHICPVCERKGWLLCSVERGPLERAKYPPGDGSAYVERTAYPFEFECGVCNLELEEDELLEFAFPTEIELEPDYDPPEADEPDWEP